MLKLDLLISAAHSNSNRSDKLCTTWPLFIIDLHWIGYGFRAWVFKKTLWWDKTLLLLCVTVTLGMLTMKQQDKQLDNNILYIFKEMIFIYTNMLNI